MQQSMECAHDLCQCTITAPVKSEEYCSESCRSTQEGGIESETCACGHPQCDVP